MRTFAGANYNQFIAPVPQESRLFHYNRVYASGAGRFPFGADSPVMWMQFNVDQHFAGAYREDCAG
jgi:hypothetical protein